MIKIFKKYKTGLVLSGGAARGFAHLGVLKALEEYNMKPDIISGVSAGSIAGVLYADGYSPEEILDILMHKKISEYFRITIPKTGFFKVTGLEDILKSTLRVKTFEELKIPLIVTVTNIEIGKPEYINSGTLIDILIASSSIPILFESKKTKGTVYVDGGIMDNLPVMPILNRCQKIIGVHVNPIGKLDNITGIAHIAERSFHLAIAAEIDRKKELFDYFIEPEKLKKYGLFDVKKGKEIFQIGYEAAKEILMDGKNRKVKDG